VHTGDNKKKDYSKGLEQTMTDAFEDVLGKWLPSFKAAMQEFIGVSIQEQIRVATAELNDVASSGEFDDDANLEQASPDHTAHMASWCQPTASFLQGDGRARATMAEAYEDSTESPDEQVQPHVLVPTDHDIPDADSCEQEGIDPSSSICYDGDDISDGFEDYFEDYSDDKTNGMGSHVDVSRLTSKVLVLRQGLRLKDFSIRQLERQLGFERSCDDWLVSEKISQEYREEQISRLADELPNGMDAHRRVGRAVEALQGDDERLEELYLQHSSGWWRSEAHCVQVACRDMELGRDHDLDTLCHDDRVSYGRHIQEFTRNLLGSFTTRRHQAQQLYENKLQILRSQHNTVRQRYLHTIFSTSARAFGCAPEMDTPEASFAGNDAADPADFNLAWPDSAEDESSVDHADASTRSGASSSGDTARSCNASEEGEARSSLGEVEGQVHHF
jgi:hypothetical protein